MPKSGTLFCARGVLDTGVHPRSAELSLRLRFHLARQPRGHAVYRQYEQAQPATQRGHFQEFGAGGRPDSFYESGQLECSE